MKDLLIVVELLETVMKSWASSRGAMAADRHRILASILMLHCLENGLILTLIKTEVGNHSFLTEQSPTCHVKCGNECTTKSPILDV